MDDREFRNAMGKFATGVTVITTLCDGEVHGMTANAFMSVSLNPKLVLISVGEKARMLEKIRETGRFAVNILSVEQRELSMQFAGQLKENREVSFDWLSGLPVIPQALVNLTCNVYSSYEAGDHTLYVGEVVELITREGEPLTFFAGKYGINVSLD